MSTAYTTSSVTAYIAYATWTIDQYNTWLSQGCPEDTNVKSLVLSFSSISELSSNIYKLPNLKCLKIRGTNISTLPSEIGLLTLLSTLDISFTNISDLKPVCKLVNLECLYASKTHITELPVEMVELKKLVVLDLANNNIRLMKSQLLLFFEQLTFLGINKMNCSEMTLQFIIFNKLQFFNL
jgi:Leucine-rich repeat (LRR) protein